MWARLLSRVDGQRRRLCRRPTHSCGHRGRHIVHWPCGRVPHSMLVIVLACLDGGCAPVSRCALRGRRMDHRGLPLRNACRLRLPDRVRLRLSTCMVIPVRRREPRAEGDRCRRSAHLRCVPRLRRRIQPCNRTANVERRTPFGRWLVTRCRTAFSRRRPTERSRPPECSRRVHRRSVTVASAQAMLEASSSERHRWTIGRPSDCSTPPGPDECSDNRHADDCRDEAHR
jgi:hypothetical protein